MMSLGVQVLASRLPALITMLEGVNEMRRGSLGDALRAAGAEIVQWNAADAGIADLLKCGLRGSPTVVKQVFAPAPRADKAVQLETKDRAYAAIADEAMARIFAAQPALEDELLRAAAAY